LGDGDACHIIRARILKPAPPQGDALDVFFEAHMRRREEQPPVQLPQVIEIGWQNDRSMKLDQFNSGLPVRFSEAMIDETDSLDTFVVTVEIPDVISSPEGRPLIIGHRPFIVYGGVRTDGDTWIFRPCPTIPLPLLGLWLEQETTLMITSKDCVREITGKNVDVENPQIRVRVTLKGNVILSKEKQLPLDGNAFGQIGPAGAAPATDLILPSGDEIRGGDFESWFYFDRAS
jgi:hypothetical protein